MARRARMELRAAGLWGAVRRLVAFAVLYVAILVPLQLLLVRGETVDRATAAVGSAVAVLAALVAGGVMIRQHGRSAGALGIAWSGRTAGEILRGLGIGAGAILVATGIMAVAGTLTYGPDDGTTGALIVVLAGDFGILAVAAMAEEALFRGYPFQLLAREFGPVFAVIVTSGLFTAAHAGNPNVGGLGLANIFLAGVLLALAYLRTRSLWFATAVHVGWNWTVAVAADLPVSGFDFMDTPLFDPVLSGPDWLTGGAFGPEGSLAVTLAAGLAILIVSRWDRVSETPAMRALRPLINGDEHGEKVVTA